MAYSKINIRRQNIPGPVDSRGNIVSMSFDFLNPSKLSKPYVHCIAVGDLASVLFIIIKQNKLHNLNYS